MTGTREWRTTCAAIEILLEQGESVRIARRNAALLVQSLEESGNQMARFALVYVGLGLSGDQITPWLEQHGYSPIRGATASGTITQTRSSEVH